MRQAVLRMEILYEADPYLRNLDFYWETMYEAMHKALPRGPWRFHEKSQHRPERDAWELRLFVRLP